MTDKILKFSASWCGPCKSLAMTLIGMDLGAPVEEVDVDTQRDLAAQYSVRGVPTLVYIKGGSEVGRLVGSQTEKQLIDWAAPFK